MLGEGQDFRHEEARPMKTSKKIFLGGLGALTPIIMNLVLIDLENVLLKTTSIVVFGYLVRVLTLFYLGGVVAWLHTDEESPVKLFELGIIAPALFMVFINATNHNAPKHENNDSNRAESTKIGHNNFSILSSAYAETPIGDRVRPTYYFSNIKDLEETKSSQFFRGLLGKPPGCQGESRQRTVAFINETVAFINELAEQTIGLKGPNLDSTSTMQQKMLELDRTYGQLPPPCQEAYRFWQQRFGDSIIGSQRSLNDGAIQKLFR